MLEAYAQTLQRLAALLGEDALIELMESMDEFEVKSSLSANPEWLQPPRPGSSSDFVYGELEGAVG